MLPVERSTQLAEQSCDSLTTYPVTSAHTSRSRYVSPARERNCR